MSCRAGCPTQDCPSYAACCKGVRIGYTNSAGGWDYSKQKRWDRELQRYRDLSDSGIEPLGTTHKDMDKTERAAEAAAA